MGSFVRSFFVTLHFASFSVNGFDEPGVDEIPVIFSLINEIMGHVKILALSTHRFQIIRAGKLRFAVGWLRVVWACLSVWTLPVIVAANTAHLAHVFFGCKDLEHPDTVPQDLKAIFKHNML
jgi:hypothetical protein